MNFFDDINMENNKNKSLGTPNGNPAQLNGAEIPMAVFVPTQNINTGSNASSSANSSANDNTSSIYDANSNNNPNNNSSTNLNPNNKSNTNSNSDINPNNNYNTNNNTNFDNNFNSNPNLNTNPNTNTNTNNNSYPNSNDSDSLNNNTNFSNNTNSNSDNNSSTNPNNIPNSAFVPNQVAKDIPIANSTGINNDSTTNVSQNGDTLKTSNVYEASQFAQANNNIAANIPDENVTDSETPKNQAVKSSFKGNDVFPEDFFWNDVLVKQRAKRKRANKISAIIITASLIFCTFVVLSSYFGKGWISNIFNGGSNIEFTLPLVEKPELDDEFYQEDGRYTAAGVAKAMEESIVSIIAYTSTDVSLGQASGSGIIMSKDGYILTNAHVIEDHIKNGIKVVLYDKTTYQATVVGSDIKTDIAVLKITADNLQPAEFGNSDSVILGEEVVALGSPGGLTGSISKGIVSGLNREIKVAANQIEMNCIQVDAAINPGNSGGALVNMWGQVVGIVSSKLSSSDFDGIGFAISMTAAKPIIEDLMEYGCIPGRIKIGITFIEINAELAELYSLPEGLNIQEIDPSSDIANTELAVGDTITHINRNKVTSKEDVSAITNDKKAGDVLDAIDIREDETFEIQFKLMDDSASLKVDTKK
ncbi:MAG: trypsin-like serine protease [Clostridiales bacterium]|nr:trypsin-like serine protease [Clostridiales bacterium]